MYISIFIITTSYTVHIYAQPFKPKLTEKTATEKQKMSIKSIKKGEGVVVTSANYDDIGSILTKIGIKYNSYTGNLTNTKMLFMNCGTQTDIPTSQLKSFVEKGGILYASDLTHKKIKEAFPNLFDFDEFGGTKGELTANVLDIDIKNELGSTMDIHFDLSGWAVLNSISSEGDIILQANGKPIMVALPYGRGTIFYTCFHNHKQASEKEELLMKLLLAKQVQTYAQMSSFRETAKEMGIELKAKKEEQKN